jgi:hypothetical protein
MFMDAKYLLSRNAPCPIRVTELGICNEVSPVLANALFPIDVTELGMVIDFKLVQPWNLKSSITVTVLGMFMDVKPEHP